MNEWYTKLAIFICFYVDLMNGILNYLFVFMNGSLDKYEME